MKFESFVELFRSCGPYYKIMDSFIRVERGLEWYMASVDAFFDIYPQALGLHPVDMSNSYLWFVNQEGEFTLEGHGGIGNGEL